MSRAREVTESTKIVIKAECGARLELKSTGSAPRGMLSAFGVLPAKRREWMLKHMQAEHEKLLAREAERAKAAGQEGGAA